MSFDMNALLKQAQEMQEQMQQMQEDAAKETAEASAGGGMVTVVASASGEIKELRIDPKAIDPDDPEMLADLVVAASNEALRAARAKVEAKMKAMLPSDLGGLLPGLQSAAIDESFFAKLLDVGSEVSFDEGHVLVEPGVPVSGLFLILHGEVLVQTPLEEYDRGAGQVVGEWEKLDGTEDVRVTAKTEVRLIAVDRAAYEAALTG